MQVRTRLSHIGTLVFAWERTEYGQAIVVKGAGPFLIHNYLTLIYNYFLEDWGIELLDKAP